MSSLHKVYCPVGCMIVVVGCPHLLTMFFCCISFRRAKMVIIGGDAGGNEGDVFLFTFFLLFLSCFSTYACMLMSFFHVFFWLLNQRSGSQPLRRNSKRPANRQPRPAQSVEQGEDVEVSGMLMTQVHFFGFVWVI